MAKSNANKVDWSDYLFAQQSSREWLGETIIPTFLEILFSTTWVVGTPLTIQVEVLRIIAPGSLPNFNSFRIKIDEKILKGYRGNQVEDGVHDFAIDFHRAIISYVQNDPTIQSLFKVQVKYATSFFGLSTDYNQANITFEVRSESNEVCISGGQYVFPKYRDRKLKGLAEVGLDALLETAKTKTLEEMLTSSDPALRTLGTLISEKR